MDILDNMQAMLHTLAVVELVQEQPELVAKVVFRDDDLDRGRQ